MKSDFERTFSNLMASVSSSSRPNTLTSSGSLERSKDVFEGQLYKFTNVVKGWQYRWFVLDSESGTLEYFLMDESSSGRPLVGKSRGSQKLCGCLVVPSDEDSQTFTVNFASGETYKLRAENAKERQIWVDRVRRVAFLFDRAVAQNQSHISLRDSLKPATPPPGAKSQLTHNGEPTDALQHLSLSVLDAFGSAYDMLQQSDAGHQALARSIESLPVATRGGAELVPPCCHDEDLLLMKATSQAALICLESALAVLQDLQEQASHLDEVPFKRPLVNSFSVPPPRSSKGSSSNSFKRKLSSASEALSPGSVFASPSSSFGDTQHSS